MTRSLAMTQKMLGKGHRELGEGEDGGPATDDP
jgi:hypothetical protein